MKKIILIFILIILLILGLFIINGNLYAITENNSADITPKIEVSYDYTEPTKENVKVTITSNKEIKGITTTAKEEEEETTEAFVFTLHEEDYKTDSEYIKENLPYLWLSSPNIDKKDSVPLIIILHGSGEFTTGKDEIKESIYVKALKNWSMDGFDGYILFPHAITACMDTSSANGWPNSGLKIRLMNIINNFIQRQGNIDLDKVILVGHSAGAVGALNVANTYPNEFDKLVVVSGYNTVDMSNINIPTLCVYADGDSSTVLSCVSDFQTRFGSKNVYSIEASTHKTVIDLMFKEDTGEHVRNRWELPIRFNRMDD